MSNADAGAMDDDAGPSAQQGPDSGMQAEPDAHSTGPFPTLTNFASDGPYRSVELSNTGPNNNFTIYHPSELAPDGTKNPILVWMNGGTSVPSIYPLLPLLATQGFVVLASNTPPGIGEEIALGQEMVAAIDWAFAEQERSGSVFMGKLDTSKVGGFGYSMGSLATFTMANDPRLTTTIHISGGNMVTERVKNLHAPAAFLCGIAKPDCSDIFAEDCDIAGAACATDFEAATTSVFYAVYEYGHTGILLPPYQERIYTEVAAWFRWQLMQDHTLKSRFAGPDCGVCSDPNWTVQRKGDLL